MFPSEMESAPRWVCWRYEQRGDRRTKIPINPKTGANASSTDPVTWADYTSAQIASGQYDGIGFVLGDGWFGIDLDHIEGDIELYRQGDTDNIVSKFIDTMQSYAEYSPSGTGIHIICKGHLPKGRKRSGNIEMYDSGRYFTMTGNRASGYELRDGTDAVKSLYEEYLGKRTEAIRVITEPTNVSEAQVLEAARSAKNSAAFETLFSGDWSSLYNSQSEADMAFCNMLAFWTGKNASMMDSIFRRSSLMRDKWDQKRGGKTYGEITISKAIDSTVEVYKPKDDYIQHITNREESVPFFSLDDTGNAERMRFLFSESLRYCYPDKAWYFYDGRVWTADTIGQVKADADDMIAFMYHQEDQYEGDALTAYQKHITKSRNSNRKEAAIKETQHLLPILPSEMDKDEFLLNTPDGIIDLRTGKNYPNSFDYYMTRITGTEFTPHADCTRWRQFLNEIFDNDQDLIRYIQKAVGYSMTGSTEEQVTFFCYGNGRNGKSVFLDTISMIMGSYATNIQPDTIMVKRNQGGANSDVARLKGSRFVTTVEPDEGMRLSEGIVKQLTGGDRVTARKQYGNEFEFTPQLKLWMGTNHKPLIRGTDEGIWRRIVLIPFNVRIEKPDKKLKYKLRAEAAAILGWMIEGCLLWQREGLEKPEAIRKADSEYRTEMDVIEQFLASEYVVRATDAECSASVLYSRYKEWAKNADAYSMSQTKFGTEMAKRMQKVRRGGGIYYVGADVTSSIIVP